MPDNPIAFVQSINLVGNKLVHLAAGVDATDGVNVQQLEDAVAGVGGSSPLVFQDYEKTGTYVYVGYEHPTAGSWQVYRRTIASNVRQDASGASSYAAAWTGRAGLTYS